MCGNLNDHVREPDLHITPVKDGVVLSDKDITNNPANARGEIDSHEAPDALSLRFNDVVLLGQLEVLASHGEGDIRGISVAVNGVFSLHQSFGSDLRCQGCDISGRSG